MTERFGDLLRALRLAVLVRTGRHYRNGPVSWQKNEPLSQAALARRAAVDPAVVSRLEAGTADRPRASTVRRLASALDLDELGTARLLVAAGYWPWPDLEPEAAELVLAAMIAIVAGDWRPLTGDAASGPMKRVL